MLENFIEQITQDWIDEGIEKGIEQGRIKTLKRLLTNKFGELSKEIESKIDNMNTDELDTLEQKIFTIQNVMEI